MVKRLSDGACRVSAAERPKTDEQFGERPPGKVDKDTPCGSRRRLLRADWARADKHASLLFPAEKRQESGAIWRPCGEYLYLRSCWSRIESDFEKGHADEDFHGCNEFALDHQVQL